MVVEAAAMTQLRRGALECCVLALLRNEEQYGFELVRQLSAHEGLVTGEGTIYPLLARLKKDGLVSTSWRDSDEGPPRKYYAITATGRNALEQLTDNWRRFRDSVDSLLNEENK